MRRINGNNPLKKAFNVVHRSEQLKNVCWICDGWHEFKVNWEPGMSANANVDPIYWHPDFEGHQPVYIPEKN